MKPRKATWTSWVISGDKPEGAGLRTLANGIVVVSVRLSDDEYVWLLPEADRSEVAAVYVPAGHVTELAVSGAPSDGGRAQIVVQRFEDEKLERSLDSKRRPVESDGATLVFNSLECACYLRPAFKIFGGCELMLRGVELWPRRD